MGLVNITTDIELKGETWRFVIDKLVGIQGEGTKTDSFKIFGTYYQVFILCAALGIMYDKKLSFENEKGNSERPISIPRNVLQNQSRRNEIEFLLTTVVISSKQIDYTLDERLMIAFEDKETSFKSMKFLEEFANYGVVILKEQITHHDLETMENIKEMLKNIINGNLTETVEIELDENFI